MATTGSTARVLSPPTKLRPLTSAPAVTSTTKAICSTTVSADLRALPGLAWRPFRACAGPRGAHCCAICDGDMLARVLSL